MREPILVWHIDRELGSTGAFGGLDPLGGTGGLASTRRKLRAPVCGDTAARALLWIMPQEDGPALPASRPPDGVPVLTTATFVTGCRHRCSGLGEPARREFDGGALGAPVPGSEEMSR